MPGVIEGSSGQLIGRLTGQVVEELEGGTVVLEVRGVGYEVTLPLGTRGRLSPNGSGEVTLFVHTHVREDALSLFGFATSTEREAFRILIGISNVGPKLAMAVLGAIAVGELATVVARGESAKLVAIPGVGKKTAERLVLELKGKLQVSVPAGATTAGPPPHAVPSGQGELLVGTLTRMGYRPAEAERAVSSLAQAPGFEEAALSDLLRAALATLSR